MEFFMRPKSRIALIIIFILISVGAIVWWTNRDKAQVAQYLTAPVVSAEIVNSVSTTGTIVDRYTYHVDTSGELLLRQIYGVPTTSPGVPISPQDDWTTARVVKAEGSNVTKGQTIVTLRNYDGSTRNITAPQKGQVLSITTFEGFKTSGEVARLGTGRILVSVAVTENQLNKFIPNQPVAIAVNSSDETTFGSVIFTSPTPEISVGNTVSYQVLIQVAPGVFPEGIKPGMSATVEFPIANDDDIRYTNARFIYEFEFSLNVENQPSLISKNGQSVLSTPSLIVNPDSWRVESLNVEVGSFVNPGDIIATLRNFDGSLKNITVKEAGFVRDVFTAPNTLVAGPILELGVGPVLAAVDVSEFDIGQIEIGQKATFTTNDQDFEFLSEVVSISAKTTIDTSAVAKFKVYLTPTDTGKNLRIGSSVRANIILQSTSARFAIPVQALKQVDGQTSVDVLGVNGEAVTQPVTVGVIGDQLAEIISGLDLDSQVIIGTRAPAETLPTQPTGPFGEGGNRSGDDEEAVE
jgi:multidrug efflux pump subunit AcrA (membrane-fusion protein)